MGFVEEDDTVSVVRAAAGSWNPCRWGDAPPSPGPPPLAEAPAPAAPALAPVSPEGWEGERDRDLDRARCRDARGGTSLVVPPLPTPACGLVVDGPAAAGGGGGGGGGSVVVVGGWWRRWWRWWRGGGGLARNVGGAIIESAKGRSRLGWGKSRSYGQGHGRRGKTCFSSVSNRLFITAAKTTLL